MDYVLSPQHVCVETPTPTVMGSEGGAFGRVQVLRVEAS